MSRLIRVKVIITEQDATDGCYSLVACSQRQHTIQYDESPVVPLELAEGIINHITIKGVDHFICPIEE